MTQNLRMLSLKCLDLLVEATVIYTTQCHHLFCFVVHQRLCKSKNTSLNHHWLLSTLYVHQCVVP